MCRVFGVQGAGCRVQGSGFRVEIGEGRYVLAARIRAQLPGFEDVTLLMPLAVRVSNTGTLCQGSGMLP